MPPPTTAFQWGCCASTRSSRANEFVLCCSSPFRVGRSVGQLFGCNCRRRRAVSSGGKSQGHEEEVTHRHTKRRGSGIILESERSSYVVCVVVLRVSNESRLSDLINPPTLFQQRHLPAIANRSQQRQQIRCCDLRST